MSDKVTMAIETITPELADTILMEQEKRIARGDYRNRPVSEPTIARYANDMRQGHWLVNNQGIGFDNKENLIDGRQRLWAVKRAGVPVKMLVIRGLSPVQKNGITVNTIDTVDCGRVRSIGQQLVIDGVANANMNAAAARTIALMVSGYSHVKMSVTQVRCILDIYGTGIRKAMVHFHTDPRIMRGFLLGTIAVYRAFEPQNADAFAVRYQAMVNLEQGSPIIAISKYLSINKQGSGVQLADSIRAVALALYHHHHGTKVNSIRRSPVGSDWLLDNQKNNVRKVREILGLK